MGFWIFKKYFWFLWFSVSNILEWKNGFIYLDINWKWNKSSKKRRGHEGRSKRKPFRSMNPSYLWSPIRPVVYAINWNDAIPVPMRRREFSLRKFNMKRKRTELLLKLAAKKIKKAEARKFMQKMHRKFFVYKLKERNKPHALWQFGTVLLKWTVFEVLKTVEMIFFRLKDCRRRKCLREIVYCPLYSL